MLYKKGLLLFSRMVEEEDKARLIEEVEQRI
jgi:hypothetical protein